MSGTGRRGTHGSDPGGSGTNESGTGESGTGESGTGESGTGESGTGESGTGESGTGESGTGESGTGESGTGESGTGGSGTGGSGTGGSGTGGSRDVGRRDTVADVVRQWREALPGLDTGPMELIGRIGRCAALIQQAEDTPLRDAGLSRAEFDLLGALRRTGRELTPGDLARETFSSGAAVTKRATALRGRGLVERRTDARDRRVAHLRLTPAGGELVDRLMPQQLAFERDVLGGVPEADREALAGLLGALLETLEGRLRR